MVRNKFTLVVVALAMAVLLSSAFGLSASNVLAGPKKEGFKVRPQIPGRSKLSSAVISTMQFGRSDGTSDKSFRLEGINAGGPASGPYGPKIDRPDAPAAVSPNVKVSQDLSQRPHNETSVGMRLMNVVIGANDYRVGSPVGGGFYASRNNGVTWMDGLMPFPLLLNDWGIVEPPAGTGDDAVAIARDGTAYQSTIGFSYTWCENGVFAYRSTNGGRTWTRPVVPGLGGPLRVVVYSSSTDSCFADGVGTDVFHDKAYMTVDNSGGAHDGRLYATWSKFECTDSCFDPSGVYLRSSIQMAYSDDMGNTWTEVGEINGTDASLCTYQADGEAAGRCDENQFSAPVVGPDGTAYVAFENEQNEACWAGGAGPGDPGSFRDQYLVVGVNPDTFAVTGPNFVACLIDGIDDYPLNTDGRQSLSNSNFRVNSAGNLAVNPANGYLYVVWSDNRNGSAAATNTDIFASMSTNGGVSWTAAKRINNDATSNDQWFPWLAVGKGGRVAVVFFDRRHDPANQLANTWVATANWKLANLSLQNFRVSNASSNFDYGFSGGRFIGDYLGLALQGCAGFTAWPDARNGTPAVRYTDLYGARFTIPGC